MSIGIDFGTTNSSIAFQQYPGDLPKCADVEDFRSIPYNAVLRTAVLLDGGGRVISGKVGAAAMDQVAWLDDRTGLKPQLISNFKPLLSTFRLHSERTELAHVEDPEGYDHLRQQPEYRSIERRIVSGDIQWSRHQLVTAGKAVFSRLLDKVPASVMAAEPRIAVGVPLTFPDYAKKRVMEMIVGALRPRVDEPYRHTLQRVRFIAEPVGAAHLYGEESQSRAASERVLVFDAGGGTLDLALLQYERISDRLRPVRQLALDGAMLAGQKFDEAIIANCLLSHREALVRANTGTARPEEFADWQLAQAAEAIKVDLSGVDETMVFLPTGPVSATRSQFEEWAQPVIHQIETLIRSVAGPLDDVDTVVMVGGTSLIPCVQQLVARLFRHAEILRENPRMKGPGEGVERSLTAVSRGLALFDDSPQGSASGVTPFGYGFFTMSDCKTVEAVKKWSSLNEPTEFVRIPVQPTAERTTLTLTQDMVRCERVLNILNVPVDEEERSRGYIVVRVAPSEGVLYPDVELISELDGEVKGAFRASELAEEVVAALVANDDHLVRWPGTSGSTPYPEIVELCVGDYVEYTQRRGLRAPRVSRGRIRTILRVADCAEYPCAVDWDMRRWRFIIDDEKGGWLHHIPVYVTDISLPRGRRREH